MILKKCENYEKLANFRVPCNHDIRICSDEWMYKHWGHKHTNPADWWKSECSDHTNINAYTNNYPDTLESRPDNWYMA